MIGLSALAAVRPTTLTKLLTPLFEQLLEAGEATSPGRRTHGRRKTR
jgi:hypothetical protein